MKTQKTHLERLKTDFVAFLFVLWRALNLPNPTRIQIAIARELETNTYDRFILEGFRGVAKTWITCAFAVWLIWRDQNLKIMVTSANSDKAAANSHFIKDILKLLPFLTHLLPRPDQRDTVEVFDVNGASPSPDPSFKSVGIFGQTTGSRADIIIGDDIEIPSNSATPALRDKLQLAVAELSSVIKPLPDAKIILLGTPQSEMTIYRELEDNRGFNLAIYPSRYPRTQAEREYYGNRLGKILRIDLEQSKNDLTGKPTNPERFGEEELLKREINVTKAGFTLQYQLNPNLSDLEKRLLRLRDLIVAELSPTEAPMTLTWLPNRKNALLDSVPNIGLGGDGYHTYESVSTTIKPYQSKILVIDPSGRGADATGYCVLYTLNGYIFMMDAGGFDGGYKHDTLVKLAKIAKRWSVHEVVIESNFGDGMFTRLFEPVLLQEQRAECIDWRSKGQKEMRIIEVLEPLFGSHRLVINQPVIRRDYESNQQKLDYSLFYQITRITRDKGSLRHDDQINPLAIGCAYVVEQMNQNASKNEQEANNQWLEEQIEEQLKFKNSYDLTVHSNDGSISIYIEDEEEDFSGLNSLYDKHGKLK